MAHNVLLVIASTGFHPVEYSVPKRILEHSGITITTASDKAGTATDKDGAATDVDISLDQVEMENFNAVFFIGGPGALEHLDNPTSYKLLQACAEAKKPFGAICASTRILAKAGVIKGKRVTGWNGDNALDQILQQVEATYIKKDVVIDGNIVTAVGPDSAQEFGSKILSILGHE